ncbi:MAG: hypothetical protein ACK5H2_02745 [Beutenbergiaceae bacterium]
MNQPWGSPSERGTPPAGAPPAWTPAPGATPADATWTTPHAAAASATGAPAQHAHNAASRTTDGAVVSTVTPADVRPPHTRRTRSSPGIALVATALASGPAIFLFLAGWDWMTQQLGVLNACVANAGGWECVVNDRTWTQVVLPVLACLLALSLSRACMVEARQGRTIGYLYGLVGIGILGYAWLAGSA